MRYRGLLVLVVAAGLLGPPAESSAQQVLVRPYLQPGDGLAAKADARVLLWLTDQTPGDFVVEFGPPAGPFRRARVERTALDFDRLPDPKKEPPKNEKPADPDDPPPKTGALPPEREQHYFRYAARLDALPFGAEVRYRVRLGDAVVREATFRTRPGPDSAARLALVGDLATGKEGQKAIAYQLSRQDPDALVALGDVVYPAGRVSQYLHFFWKTYNDVDEAGPTTGAPLMATIPFHVVLGNHDVAAKYPAVPDALGAFYFFRAPRNGPGEGPWSTPLGADKAAAARFRAANADSYPWLGAYSFDHGPAHILVVDSNQSSNVDQPRLRQWAEADLKASPAPWKFVCYHAPAFQSSTQHYTEQALRLWQPLFEECGVDMTFAGHVHNYQRSVPIRFTPTTAKRDKKGRVDGEFVLDTAFDGERNTRPTGLIHIVAGGGGASLYGPALEKTAPKLKEENGENYADFTARHVADRHTFVVLDLTATRLTLRAIDARGDEVDRVVLTKPAREKP